MDAIRWRKILTAVGASSAGMLAKLLGEPIIGYPAVADLLAHVGDDATRQKGAASLVARAHHEHPIPELMWKAIGLLGGPVAVAFLEEKVAHGSHEEAMAAVRALQQRREPTVLPFALKVAGDSKADKGIRDEMFGVVESIGGLDARDGLVRIIQTDKEELVRYRAFESILAVAKQDGVIPGAGGVSRQRPLQESGRRRSAGQTDREAGPAARPVLTKALESKYPLARMTAVMSLERLGKAADADALKKITKDTTGIKGFPAGDTIGKEAARVAVAIGSKT